MISLPTNLDELQENLLDVFRRRRSVRRFGPKPLAVSHVACLVWACGGRRDLTSRSAKRTVPSAGATYPMTVYVVCGDSRVGELEAGLYLYDANGHALEKIADRDLREDLADACFSQNFISQAPISIILAADYAITTGVYGERGVRYVHMEAGHAGQNIYLACTALGLSTVAVGAFNDEAVARVLGLPLNVEPLYVFPIGYRD